MSTQITILGDDLTRMKILGCLITQNITYPLFSIHLDIFLNVLHILIPLGMSEKQFPTTVANAMVHLLTQTKERCIDVSSTVRFDCDTYR